MIKYTFEDYLTEKHAEVYTGLDDDMPDAFDNWLTELDGEEYIHFGNLFALKFAGMQLDEIQKKILQVIEKP